MTSELKGGYLMHCSMFESHKRTRQKTPERQVIDPYEVSAFAL